MLDKLGWWSLKQQRADQRLIILYKIVNNLVEVDQLIIPQLIFFFILITYVVDTYCIDILKRNSFLVTHGKLFFLFLLSHSKDCQAKALLKSAVPVKVNESFTP